jgi:hypothetical protein
MAKRKMRWWWSMASAFYHDRAGEHDAFMAGFVDALAREHGEHGDFAAWQSSDPTVALQVALW